jgi:RimJ/RimL family protein N-acetyltransferase
MLTIPTARLELIAATPLTARAEADDVQEWWRLLEASAPTSWPPPLNDRASLRWFAAAIERDPEAVGWYTWYVTDWLEGSRRLLGNAGFTGRPDDQGSVEIGYALLPPYHRRGFGTEAVDGLIRWAFERGVARILAETYPELVGSIRVLEKNGFSLVGRAHRPGAIRFELRRTVFTARAAAAVQAGTIAL